MNTGKAKMMILCLTILGVGLSLTLTGCYKQYPFIDCGDDTLIALERKQDSFCALGSKRIYVLLGQKRYVIKGRLEKVLPGQCYEMMSGEVKSYVMYHLIYSNCRKFPELKDPRILKIVAAQNHILRDHPPRVPGGSPDV